MAEMVIHTDWAPEIRKRFRDPDSREFYPRRVIYPNGGGYTSEAEMTRELLRRHRHRGAKRIPDGIECAGECGLVQRITWQE